MSMSRDQTTRATLQGLRGCANPVVAPYFRTVLQAERLLVGAQAVTAAADYGAITVWRTDDGQLTAERHVRMILRARIDDPSKAQLRAWLKEQLKDIGL